jgi:hypothetical protein
MAGHGRAALLSFLPVELIARFSAGVVFASYNLELCSQKSLFLPYSREIITNLQKNSPGAIRFFE